MNKWIKVISIGGILGVVTAVLLILSGLGTSSVLTYEGTYLTSTTVSLDVNLFALLMIIGVSLTGMIAYVVFEKVR